MENEQVKTVSLINSKTLSIAKFVALLGLAILAPLAQNQLITGTIVNAVLFASVFVLGIQGALAIAFFPSVISLGLGLLPAIMTPMIPFIVLGNLILVGLFAAFKNRSYWLAAAGASVIKFIWLLVMSQIVISLFIKGAVSTKIAAMMSWPQLITAIAGAIIAYVFVKKIFVSK
jgi:hypothetical protein